MRSPTIGSIQALLDRANRDALRLLEQTARRIMREHPECHEFVMAMGSASISVHPYDLEYDDGSVGLIEGDLWSVGGLWTSPCARPDWLDPLDAILSEFDDILHLSGTPMRFTAAGPLRSDW